MSLSKHMELRSGYNNSVRQYFIEIIDTDTQDNMRVYLGINEMQEFLKDFLNFTNQERRCIDN